MAVLVMWDVDRDGAGVSGGGGEQVEGGRGAGQSNSKGLGVRRGGVGVAGAEEGVGAESEAEDWLPLDGSLCSGWL